MGVGPSFFFFNDTATTEIYTLSLHDALPICKYSIVAAHGVSTPTVQLSNSAPSATGVRSEEHTSELQSRSDIVCRLLLEKKKTRGACRAPTTSFQPSTTPATRRTPR